MFFSAVDSYGDTSANFYYQNDSWHVIFITGNFVDNETFNLRMADKQDVLVEGEGITISGNEISTDRSKVVANPTLSGDEPDLESAEIDGIKYKVGGGGKLYHHHILIEASSEKFLTINITSTSNVAYTYSTIYAYINTITNDTGYAEKGYNCISRNGRSYGYSCCATSNLFYLQSYDGSITFSINQSATVTDTITEA